MDMCSSFEQTSTSAPETAMSTGLTSQRSTSVREVGGPERSKRIASTSTYSAILLNCVNTCSWSSSRAATDGGPSWRVANRWFRPACTSTRLTLQISHYALRSMRSKHKRRLDPQATHLGSETARRFRREARSSSEL